MIWASLSKLWSWVCKFLEFSKLSSKLSIILIEVFYDILFSELKSFECYEYSLLYIWLSLSVCIFYFSIDLGSFYIIKKVLYFLSFINGLISSENNLLVLSLLVSIICLISQIDWLSKIKKFVWILLVSNKFGFLWTNS